MVEETRYTKKQSDALLAEHDKILIRGNGEPSFQERFRQLHTSFESLKRLFDDDMKERKEERKYYTRLMMGIVITNVFSLVAAAAYFMIRFAPVIEKLELSSR